MRRLSVLLFGFLCFLLATPAHPSPFNQKQGGTNTDVVQAKGTVTTSDGAKFFGDKPWVSAVGYGAVRDGTTDDVTAINSAVTSLGAAGGTVLFAPGVYRVNSAINLASNVRLLGATGAVIKTTAQGGFVAAISASAVNNVSVENLEITADGTNVLQNGILISGCTRVWLLHNYLHDIPEHGITMTLATTEFVIDHNIIETTDSNSDAVGVGMFGVFEGSGYGTISNNVLRNIFGGAIVLDAGTSGGAGVPGFNVAVTGNTVSFTGGGGLVITGVNSVTATGNMFVQIGEKTNTTARAITIARDSGNSTNAVSQRIVIVGNVIDRTTDHAIFIDGASDFLIADNLIFDTGRLSPPPGSGYGILLSTASGTTSRGQVKNNHVRYSGSGGVLTAAVLLNTGVTSVVTAGNTMSGSDGTYGVVRDLSASATNVVGGNTDLTAGVTQPVGFRGFVDMADHVLTGSTSQTDLSTYPLNADLMGVSARLRVSVAGTTAGSAGTKTVKVFFGNASANVLASSTAGTFQATVDIDNTTVSAQRWNVLGYLGTTIDQNTYQTSAVSTGAGGVTVKCTGTLVNAADTITLTKFTVEVVR